MALEASPHRRRNQVLWHRCGPAKGAQELLVRHSRAPYVVGQEVRTLRALSIFSNFEGKVT
jgi:hypothetical protein